MSGQWVKVTVSVLAREGEDPDEVQKRAQTEIHDALAQWRDDHEIA